MFKLFGINKNNGSPQAISKTAIKIKVKELLQPLRFVLYQQLNIQKDQRQVAQVSVKNIQQEPHVSLSTITEKVIKKNTGDFFTQKEKSNKNQQQV